MSGQDWTKVHLINQLWMTETRIAPACCSHISNFWTLQTASALLLLDRAVCWMLKVDFTIDIFIQICFESVSRIDNEILSCDHGMKHLSSLQVSQQAQRYPGLNCFYHICLTQLLTHWVLCWTSDVAILMQKSHFVCLSASEALQASKYSHVLS